MKTFKLVKSDTYDLATVAALIVKDHSEKLDFKEVLHLQKMAIAMGESVKDYGEVYEKIAKDKDKFVANANKKIDDYKAKLQKDSNADGKLPADYKEKLDAFVADMLKVAQSEIDSEIIPQYTELYKGLGAEIKETELENDKYDMLVINFEKYAKEKYNNKSRMVVVYEALISAVAK